MRDAYFPLLLLVAPSEVMTVRYLEGVMFVFFLMGCLFLKYCSVFFTDNNSKFVCERCALHDVLLFQKHFDGDIIR